MFKLFIELDGLRTIHIYLLLNICTSIGKIDTPLIYDVDVVFFPSTSSENISL